ncbi:MAG: HEAT repeat domain-containing protein, partial [Fuerstiella sp.]
LDQQEGAIGNRWVILNTAGGRERAEKLNALAKLAQSPNAASEAKLQAAASSEDAAMRWWAITGLSNLKSVKGESLKAVEYAAYDASVAVRIAAARGLHRAGKTNRSIAVLSDALKNESDFVKHAAIIELDEMGAAAAASKNAITQMQKQMALDSKKGGYIANIATHALSQFSD